MRISDWSSDVCSSDLYPAAGTPNALVELYVMKPEGGAPVKVDLGTEKDIYLARVDWSKDGRTLYVQRESRDQKTLDLLAVDPATGKARAILTERAKSWINQIGRASCRERVCQYV